jgi:rod shape determining protein RodA
MFESHLNEREGRWDWTLLCAAFCLMAIGVLFVCSATTFSESSRALPWFKQVYIRQIAWCAVGISGAVVLSAIDYVTLARWSMVGYWGMIILLVLVFAFPAVNGARRWIDLGFGFNLQPSEFAKIAFIFLMANFLSRPIEELRMPEAFWKAVGMTVLPFGLILKEPDMGSALVFLPISLVMMFVAGVPKAFLAKLIGGIGLLAVVALFVPQLGIVKSYQRDRLLTYFGPKFAHRNATPEERKELARRAREKGYNVEQALISVGSGGLKGKGWRQGKQYALGFLPRAGAHNDFIFSVIAEEEGFVGSVVILALYTVLFFCGIRTAGEARDRLGKLLAIGVVVMLFTHVFINIGMNIRLMPVTGIPLPLLSYGGSSVVCSLIAIGILHNVHIHRRSY